jgi:hypothetical protein
MSGVVGLSVEDAELAFTPVARVPLDSLRDHHAASVVFVVPAGEQWGRIRGSWGDPGYAVFGVSEDHSSVCSASALGLAVEASTGRGDLRTEPAKGAPYGYSTNAEDPTVVFRPRPGDRVRLDITVRNPDELPHGELVVRANWDGTVKDQMTGMLFSVDLRPYIRVCTLLGIMLFVTAAMRREERSVPSAAAGS